mgnify:CR=1 FL=1
MEETYIPQNIRVSHDEDLNRLIIEIDLDEEVGRSSSGKMVTIAVTDGGFVALPVMVNGKVVKLNLYCGISAY